MRRSIIIPCLESHEAVRRQILWLDSWIKPFSNRWHVIIVDDGSEPPIAITCPANFNLTCIRIPPHKTKWTHPIARNRGAESCPGSKFLFFLDIDHILTPETLTTASSFNGDMMRFPRRIGALDKNGKLLTSRKDLLQFGAAPDELESPKIISATVCLVRSTVQETIGGFSEIFCGQYGREGIEYKKRYEHFVHNEKCKPPELSPTNIYVFPNPRKNRQKLFHSLKR
jgi:glycosyltransferase involved in cell wall biosynthesis